MLNHYVVLCLPGLSAVSGPCASGYYCDSGASRADPTDGSTGDICPTGRYCGTSVNRDSSDTFLYF